MAKNIIEKIWDEHVVVRADGFPDIFAIDLHLMHEVTSPQAFAILRERGIGIYAPERNVATVDHNVSTAKDRRLDTSPESWNQLETLRRNCEEFGVKLLDIDSGRQGIVHVIGPELGLTQPGMTIVCGDSHTSTHGAFGAIAFGVGTTELGHVLASGCMLQNRPKTMRVNFEGNMPFGVRAKDVILKMIGELGFGGGTGYVIEYEGEAIRGMSMEERMTICNMSIECGARAGLVAPDEVTFEYLKGRICAPRGDDFARALKYWQSLLSDKGAIFDKEITIDIGNMEPMVTWGTNPSEVVGISDVVPDSDPAALEYMGLKCGEAVEGLPVDYVFIGSCTNARLSDLREAAAIMKGRKVAEGVVCYVVPGSEAVREAAAAEGLIEIFEEAGADFRNPGCSMCLAMNADKVPAGKRCASTSNRNFVGRQGKDSRTHLMSPIMAAAAAITGRISDVREFLSK